MSTIWEKAFWKDTTERVVSSAAQGALVGWGATILFSSIDQVVTAAEAAGFGALGMGVATFLKCLIASKVGDPGSASLVTLGDHEAPPGGLTG